MGSVRVGFVGDLACVFVQTESLRVAWACLAAGAGVSLL
jgi:hypothetical protein